MWIVTLKQMMSKHYEWEKCRVPCIPFPTRYLLKCMFTMYLLLFLVAFFMYQIFIVVSLRCLTINAICINEHDLIKANLRYCDREKLNAY